MKSLSFAAAAVLVWSAGAALAETPAANSDDCLKVAFDIAQVAEAKNLSNEKLDEVEDLLTKMETYCDAKQFTEAAAVASDLKIMISKE
jgi:hypothetical protein